MENVTNQSTETTTEVKLPKIEIEEPAHFDATAEVNITTTIELCKVINDIFFEAFDDYAGTIINCQPSADGFGNVLVPTMYFKILPESGYANAKRTAFRPMSNYIKSASNPAESIIRLSKAASVPGIKINITDDAKSILSDFIQVPNRPDAISKFKWEEAYKGEIRNNQTMIRVFKLDIVKFVKKIYGEFDSDKSKLYYQVTPTAALTSGAFKGVNNWVINILRLNAKNQNAAAELLGWGPGATDGSDYIVTERASRL